MNKIKEMNMLELAYWAGIIDGEGSISISHVKSRKSDYPINIQLYNTDKNLIEEFRSFFHSKHCVKKRKKQKLHYKNCYSTTIMSWKAYKIIKRMLPFLKIKYKQALLAIEFWNKMNHNKKNFVTEEELNLRKSYWSQMKKLNRRGNGGNKNV